MNKLDRVIIALFMFGVLALGYRQYKLTDRTEELNKAIKLLATATLETKMHCDVAGERTDELWEEVFSDIFKDERP